MSEEFKNDVASDATKMIAIGDTDSAKTCLLIAFARDYHPENSEKPPIFYDHYDSNIEVDGKSVKLSLWDTDGAECYDAIRTLSYPNSEVVLLCFAIDNPQSLANISTKWIPEVKANCPTASLVLVGNKSDLRNDGKTASLKLVAREEGLAFAEKIGAYKYVECSPKTREGVKNVFEVAVAAASQGEKQDSV